MAPPGELDEELDRLERRQFAAGSGDDCAGDRDHRLMLVQRHSPADGSC